MAHVILMGWLVGCCVLMWGAAAWPWSHPVHAFPTERLRAGHPDKRNCSERYFTQLIDNFADNSTLADAPNKTFQRRYFVCMEQNWKPNATIDRKK